MSDIDNALSENDLMNQLKSGDKDLADALKEEQVLQDAKLEQRRALLRARRKNKIAHEQEEKRLKEKIAAIEEEDAQANADNEAFLKQAFKKHDGIVVDQETAEKKGELLNEYMSDQFLQRLSNLMMKQFTEKEQALKLLLQKYMDEGVSEQNAIKANFKIDYDKL